MTQKTLEFADLLAAVRTRHPLVHNITNYVVMNSTANALLALGAGWAMGHPKQGAPRIEKLSVRVTGG